MQDVRALIKNVLLRVADKNSKYYLIYKCKKDIESFRDTVYFKVEARIKLDVPRMLCRFSFLQCEFCYVYLRLLYAYKICQTIDLNLDFCAFQKIWRLTQQKQPSSQRLHADFCVILTHLLKATKTRRCRYIKRNQGDVKSCQRTSTNSGLSNPSVRMLIKTQTPNNKHLTCCQSFVLGLLIPKSTTD